MKTLVIGTGGREHALARALSRDPGVTEVHAAPGNPGMAAVATLHEVDPHVGRVGRRSGRPARRRPRRGRSRGAAGRRGRRRRHAHAGIACFGPSAGRRAARGVQGVRQGRDGRRRACRPRAPGSATTPSEAADALDAFGPPYVVKDDGLAAGKGVVVTADREAALAHAAACGRVVIEEYLDGPEVSLFAITDGATVYPLQPAQDFKRICDGDEGPNTGGMGAYTPLPWAPPGLVDEVLRDVLQPTVDEMARRGTPFGGLLYAGLALTAPGVRVVEFNARFGDPETQPLLALLDSPLAALLYAAATGALHEVGPPRVEGGRRRGGRDGERGLPGVLVERRRDQRDRDADVEEDVARHPRRDGSHADGDLVTSGGRVLAVTAVGADVADARAKAYEGVAAISFGGAQHRTDIARCSDGGSTGSITEGSIAESRNVTVPNVLATRYAGADLARSGRPSTRSSSSAGSGSRC